MGKIKLDSCFFFSKNFNLLKLYMNKRVSVSLITIEGTNCKLGLLGDIADKTGGIVKFHFNSLIRFNLKQIEN